MFFTIFNVVAHSLDLTTDTGSEKLHAAQREGPISAGLLASLLVQLLAFKKAFLSFNS